MQQLPLGVRLPDRAVFASFLAARNANARRYVWQAKGEDILRKIAAAKAKLAARQAGSV